MSTYAATSRPLAIAVVALVHLSALLLWLWTEQRRPKPAQESRRSFIQWLLPAKPPTPQARLAALPPPVKQQPSAPAAAPRNAVTPALAITAPSAAPEPATAEPAPDLLAKPAPLQLSTRELALAAAGKADANERKHDLPLPRLPVSTPYLRMVAKIKAAQVHKWDEAASIEEISNTGGDRMYKVTGPLGTYCVRSNSNQFTKGRDPFKDTGKLTATNCP